MPISVLHFADAHIDMVTTGRLDPESGLPIRVTDFLSALDQIVDRAVEEKVDLVIFAGDAYKDRNPQPTYQREWGKRLMRLSAAKIPTILLVGNHDVARASGRAHTLHEYATLEVPYLHVADTVSLLGPDQLDGLPVQVITLPWVSRSALLTRQESSGKSVQEIYAEIEDRLTTAVNMLIERADPELPLILTAHASVSGAKTSSEKTIMLGQELVLPKSLVARKGIDYVALGHIHKHQDLSGGTHPPIVYPGSIERIDFGEVREEKGFVLASVEKEKSTWNFEKLKTRRFIDLRLDTPEAETFMQDILSQLPDPNEVAGAICRVQLIYPRDWETLLDEPILHAHFSEALSLQIYKQRETSKRSRLGESLKAESLTPLELLDIYWKTLDLEVEESEILQKMAVDLFSDVE
ncbi:MAG: exonuclease SbcCD subunit D [Chloroflexota bacterium]